MRQDVQQVLDKYQSLQHQLEAQRTQVSATQSKLDELLNEQQTSENAKVAIGAAKALLSSSSVGQLLELLNTGLHSIFETDSTIHWNPENSRLELHDSTGLVTDLQSGNGGGLNATLSFICDLYLIVKSGHRKLLIYDEAFTSISDIYFGKFMDFMKQACHDLGVDLLCVSHDVRLQDEMVDHVFQIVDGKSIKVK